MPELPEAAVDAALARRSDLLADRPDPMVLSERRLVTLMLEAAAPILAEAAAGDLVTALRSIASRITTSAMDYSDYEPNAWVYGIAVGWDCEEDHDHDDLCGGTAAMAELTARFGWGDDAVTLLRQYRRAYAVAVGEVPGE
jgi:hypothetical protein